MTKIQTTTASKTVNTNMPTATVNGNRWNDKVYPYASAFPSLPSPVAPWSYSCDSARTILANDIINCTFPLVNNKFNAPDKADLAAIDSVNCICTSSWKIGSQELDFILKSSCLPPGNLTKTNTFAIRDGCNINPYNYDSVIDSVGVMAHIINGDIYRPFSSNLALKEPHHAKIFVVLFYLI